MRQSGDKAGHLDERTAVPPGERSGSRELDVKFCAESFLGAEVNFTSEVILSYELHTEGAETAAFFLGGVSLNKDFAADFERHNCIVMDGEYDLAVPVPGVE